MPTSLAVSVVWQYHIIPVRLYVIQSLRNIAAIYFTGILGRTSKAMGSSMCFGKQAYCDCGYLGQINAAILAGVISRDFYSRVPCPASFADTTPGSEKRSNGVDVALTSTLHLLQGSFQTDPGLLSIQLMGYGQDQRLAPLPSP